MSSSDYFDEMFRDQVYGPRDGMQPREWQVKCMESYLVSIEGWSQPIPHVFCVYAGTGSGKTKAAGMIVAAMLNSGKVDQVVIVCPNKSIRNKTKKEFLRYFGVELTIFHKRRHGDGIPRMQQGYILTYSALMQDPTLHRRLCKASRTLVIFDEVHHLGDSNGWGNGAEESFGGVPFIIALTGTPYRSDNTRIPFVCYEETERNGILRFKPNYTYSLGRAVADGVCRKPLFHFHDGKVSIRLGLGAGEITADFSDHKVNQTISSLRLLGAVKYGSTDRRGMLRDALQKCRDEKRKAIIFLGGDTQGDETPTQDATTCLPAELQELGYDPEDYDIVTGDDGGAQAKIEAFGAHETKWILISINMVSEGTDIPELSAAIFLTSITAKQTTVQRIGRSLRLMGESDQHKDALIFMFADKDLIELADEMDDEIKCEINLQRKKREAGCEGESERERRTRAEAIGIGEGNLRMVKFHGREWPAEVIDRAKRKLRDKGLPQTMLNAVLQLLDSEGKI